MYVHGIGTYFLDTAWKYLFIPQPFANILIHIVQVLYSYSTKELAFLQCR